MIIYNVIIWSIVLLSILTILFIYIILHIKRRIYDILNEEIDLTIDDNISYPIDFDINKFNVDIYKYLIKILVDFNKENLNKHTIIYSDIYDKIFYIYYNKKKLFKIILDKNRYLWIVIRGTLTYSEFEHDLRISQCYVDDMGSKCHCGFFEIYTSVKNSLFEIIEKTSPRYIFCLGHSLGGGIISIASQDLFDKYGKNTIIYTTGTPRTCNTIFKNKIANYNFYKIENMSDTYVNVIPAILPFCNNLCYEKIGKVIYFDDNRKNITINHKLEIYYENISNYNILKSMY
jgi:hypothetical protein